MSIKTTKNISRDRAMLTLLKEIPNLSNHALGRLMDELANTDEAEHLSNLDNFEVKDKED